MLESELFLDSFHCVQRQVGSESERFCDRSSSSSSTALELLLLVFASGRRTLKLICSLTKRAELMPHCKRLCVCVCVSELCVVLLVIVVISVLNARTHMSRAISA